MTSPQVGSPAFFRRFDDLAVDAEDLEDAGDSLRTAKENREEAQKRLAKQQKELRSMRAFIKEQKQRIELVSKHWFYGTTFLQPQLWLRGGCRGKIERARVKLTKAQDQDLPVLLTTIHNIQNTELPSLEADVENQFARFEKSANAASEREVMKLRVYEAFPTPLLLQLQSKQDGIEHQMNSQEEQAENLEEVITKLFEARNVYHQAQRRIDAARTHSNKWKTLKETSISLPKPIDQLNSRKHRRKTETLVADGTRIIVIEKRDGQKDIFHLDRYGKILTTNFPCPCGCGYLVTWHETHCCTACKRTEGRHGKRCDRKAISTQQGAPEKLAKIQAIERKHLQQLAAEESMCNRSFADARKEAKHAERVITQALHSISHAVREQYTSECASLIFAPKPFISPHGGFSGPTFRAMEIQQEEEVIAFHQNRLSQQLNTVQKLQTSVRQHEQQLKQQLTGVVDLLTKEQERIFDEIRKRARVAPETPLYDPDFERPPPFAPHSIPTPTAPTEDQIFFSPIDPLRPVKS